MFGVTAAAEWTGAAIGASFAAGLMAYAVRGKSSTFFGPSAYRGNPRHSLALTFDDGPSESTPALLELLAEYDVHATFFMCGRNVRRLPEIARQVAQAGHEIGNHTDSHPYIHFHSPTFIYGQLARAQETIRQTTGITPRVFRAPYGIRWFGLRRALDRLDLSAVMWTVIGHDWNWPTGRIARLLLARATDGAIVCLHDGRVLDAVPDVRPTLNALQHVLPILKERGFQFETVSEILAPA